MTLKHSTGVAAAILCAAGCHSPRNSHPSPGQSHTHVTRIGAPDP